MKRRFDDMKIIPFVFLLSIFSVAAFGQTMTIKVYYQNENHNPNTDDCRLVYPVKRTIPKTKAIAQAALEELFKGVTTEEKAQGYSSFSPAETKGILKSIKIKNKAAYINFNKIVYNQLGSATTSCGGSNFFSSIEKTLKQFPTIKKFFYAIEGSPRDFYEWVQVGECPKELKNCSGKDF
jgi:spore germination protein GerM